MDHKLIQIALNWYHVQDFARLIFNYYEQLCAMIVTKEWSAGFSSSTLTASRERIGLGPLHFKKMQVVKYLLIKGLRDPDLQTLYKQRTEREAKLVGKKITHYGARHNLRLSRSHCTPPTLFASRQDLGGNYYPKPLCY